MRVIFIFVLSVFSMNLGWGQVLAPNKEVSFKLDDDYESHSWNVGQGYISHAQYKKGEIHYSLFDETLNLKYDYRIITPTGFEKRKSVFRDHHYIVYYSNKNQFWVLKFNPQTKEQKVLEGSISGKNVLDNVLLNPNAILVQECNKMRSKYTYQLYSFDNKTIPQKAYEGYVSYFLDRKNTYYVFTYNSLRQFDQTLSQKSATLYEWGEKVGNIKQQSIVEINGNLHLFGLAYYNKRSSSSYNLIHAKIEGDYLKVQKVLPITSFDHFFDYELENKDKLLVKRDKLSREQKTFKHGLSIASHSARGLKDGALLVFDVARPIEKLEEAFGMEDKDRWVICGYEYLFSINISYSDIDKTYNDAYFDLRTEEAADPLTYTFEGILFGLDSDPFYPYAKSLRPMTIAIASGTDYLMASYRDGFLNIKESNSADKNQYHQIDNKFDLQKKERVFNEYIYAWGDKSIILLFIKKSGKERFIVFREFKL